MELRRGTYRRLIPSRLNHHHQTVQTVSGLRLLLGLGGLLAGSYLWGHLGPPAKDPDDTEAYLCGLLLGGALATGGFGALLWKFWPRATTEVSQSSGTRPSVPD